MLAGMSTIEDIAALTARERVRIAGSAIGGLFMAESPDKVGALVEVVRALDRIGAPYALVGGVAVGIRSKVARATIDTDLAVRSNVPRPRVVQALRDAGFHLRGQHTHTVNLRHASGEPVQLVFDPAFDAMIDRAEPVDIGGLSVRVVTTDDLIAMKERAARDPARRRSKALRDRADVELLRGDIPDPDEGW
jgi:predicted nucleotidyltransferase